MNSQPAAKNYGKIICKTALIIFGLALFVGLSVVYMKLSRYITWIGSAIVRFFPGAHSTKQKNK